MSLTDEQAWQIVREAWDANGWMPMGHSEDEWPDSRYTSVVRAAYAAGERAMRERGLTFTMVEADMLLQCFGGEPGEWTVRSLPMGAITGDEDVGPSPAGLWAHMTDYPEEGCIYLGPADDPDAMPESSIVASAPALAARVAELDAEVARLREALRELLNGWPRGHLPETAKRGYRALGAEK